MVEIVSNLHQDFKNGKIQLYDATVNYFIDATTDLFNDSKSRQNTWCKGEVVDIDLDSEDQEDPNIFVTYDEYESDDKENGWFLLSFFEGYLKRCILFVDVYTSSDKKSECTCD